MFLSLSFSAAPRRLNLGSADVPGEVGPPPPAPPSAEPAGQAESTIVSEYSAIVTVNPKSTKDGGTTNQLEIGIKERKIEVKTEPEELDYAELWFPDFG